MSADMPTYQELAQRLAAVEDKVLGIGDLPLKGLANWLTNNWQPDTNQLVPPGSVGAAQLANIPNCRVARSGQTTNIGSTVLSWDTDVWDQSNMHSTTTNPDRVVCNIPGIYVVVLMIQEAGTTASNWDCTISAVNPSPRGTSTAATATGNWIAGQPQRTTIVGAEFMSATGYFTASWGISYNTTTSSQMMAFWVGPNR